MSAGITRSNDTPAFNPSGDTDATAGPLRNLFGLAPFGADDLGYCGFGGRHFENLSHLSLSPYAHPCTNGWLGQTSSKIDKSVDCQ